MGLDTSHDCWHGSYSGFGEWRTAIARAAGRPVGPTRYGEGYIVEPDQPEDRFYGWWGWFKVPDDPLDVLLVHSDCEGFIFWWQTEPLADRLEALDLSDAFVGKERGYYPDGWVAERRDQFVKGLRYAAERRENVEFR